MRNHMYKGDWVNQYLRDELSASDEEAFETALLESTELQQELEAALALRAILERASDETSASQETAAPKPLLETNSGWRPMALAAAILLAVVSTVMWWKSGNELATLEQQMLAMSHPRTEVLTVPVSIMRSASNDTPDVIVQIPQGRAAILLDIELGLRAREETELHFALIDPEGSEVLAWQAVPTANGRSSVVIPGEHIPASELWLEISDAEGDTVERRLLEFRH